jgi:hypothetical protein
MRFVLLNGGTVLALGNRCDDQLCCAAPARTESGSSVFKERFDELDAFCARV